MIFFLGILLAMCAVWILVSVYYVKSTYDELEILRIENVALKLKLAVLIGELNDQA